MIRIALVMLLATVSVLGCTAVEGQDPIGDSNRFSWTLGAISAVLVLITFTLYRFMKPNGRWVVILGFVLLVIHPAWTVSAWGGDCGVAKVEYSKWFLGAIGTLAILQTILWAAGNRRSLRSL